MTGPTDGTAEQFLGPVASTGVPGELHTLSSTLVFSSPWLRFREDRFVRADGYRGTYGVVDKPDFALAVPAQEDGFHLVEQYRYAIRRRSWEFPMGGWPRGRSGTPLELAQAELGEEIGAVAKTWTPLGHLQSALGYSSQGFDVFLATDLDFAAPHREDSEADMVTRWVPESEFRRMIRDGRIVDSVTLSAYALLRLHREQD